MYFSFLYKLIELAQKLLYNNVEKIDDFCGFFGVCWNRIHAFWDANFKRHKGN